MNPQWYPVLANVAVTLFGLGVIWGVLHKRIVKVESNVEALAQTISNVLTLTANVSHSLGLVVELVAQQSKEKGKGTGVAN